METDATLHHLDLKLLSTKMPHSTPTETHSPGLDENILCLFAHFIVQYIGFQEVITVAAHQESSVNLGVRSPAISNHKTPTILYFPFWGTRSQGIYSLWDPSPLVIWMNFCMLYTQKLQQQKIGSKLPTFIIDFAPRQKLLN